MPAIPGIALLWGWLIGRLTPAAIPRYISLSALLLTLSTQLYIGNWDHERDDWRGALTRAAALSDDRDTPLALYSGFMESASLASLQSPQHRDFLLAPVAAYPVPTKNIVAIPLLLDSPSQNYWEREFKTSILGHNSFHVVLRGEFSHREWTQYIVAHGRRNGYRLERFEEYGRLKSTRFLRFVRVEPGAN
jgi:hypothetical protein